MTALTTHLVLLPLLIPFLGGIGALLLKHRGNLQPWWSLAAMSTALVSSVRLLTVVWQTGQPQVLQLGNWPAPFGISLVADLVAVFFVCMSHLVLVLGVLYAMGSKDSCVRYPTFYAFFLFLATGLTGAFLTGDIFNLFVFIELLAIASTILTAISDDRYGTEAAYNIFRDYPLDTRICGMRKSSENNNIGEPLCPTTPNHWRAR